MEGVTTGDMSVDKAASSYDDELKSATDNQVTEK
jgi:multiple sugar transport system substrate-binding protein